MSQSTTVTTFEVGAMSAVVGAGIGYALAPRKYNLEQLLTIKPDVFEKSLPQQNMVKATDAQKIARDAIVKAREAISEAEAKNAAEEKLIEFLKSPDLDDYYRTIKESLPKARAQSAIIVGLLAGAVGTIARMIYNQKHS